MKNKDIRQLKKAVDVITYAYLRIEDIGNILSKLPAGVITYAYLRIEDIGNILSKLPAGVITYAYLRIEDIARLNTGLLPNSYNLRISAD